MTTRAATATTLTLAFSFVLGLCLTTGTPAKADYNAPWKDEDRALVIDAYEFNPIDWDAMTSDKRIAGFINKGSDGLPPAYRCGSVKDDDWKLCKNRWWKYSVTKELFMTRKQIAQMKGLLWGAYHLGRPGNPRAQADHFVDFAEPGPNDLLALDIEDLNDEWMSLDDAEIFADQVKIRTGRYPVLYTNGNTAKHISDNRSDYPLLSRLPLWYARYTGDITGKFPEETWDKYALWQFASMHNCNARSCPYRVKGAKTDIDVNVSTFDVAGLKQAWPFDELNDEPVTPADPGMLVASIEDGLRDNVAAAMPKPSAAKASTTLLAAYGPTGRPNKIDPLKMLSDVARGEPHAAERPAHDETELAGEPAPGMPVPTMNPRRSGERAAFAVALAETAKQAEEEARKAAVVADTVQPSRSHPVPHRDEITAQRLGQQARDLKQAIETTMNTLRVIVAPARRDADETAWIETKPAFGPDERSKFLRQMQAAIAARNTEALAMPAAILSKDKALDEEARSGRSPRLENIAYASLGVTDRISRAFSATR